VSKSEIGWTDEVWNPVTGCTRVSAGCARCYASALHNKRYRANVQAGLLAVTRKDVMVTGLPVAALRAMGWEGLPYPDTYDTPFAVVTLHPERLEAPLHWRKSRRVFVNSMSDLFHEEVPDEFLDRVFAVMALTPQHTYQVLTKRTERMREYLHDGSWDENEPEEVRNRVLTLMDENTTARGEDMAPMTWPLPNVWLGTSVEDQRSADERVPILLETPAAVRFVSVEPLLEPVDLTALDKTDESDPGFSALTWCEGTEGTMGDAVLDWVIVGGESGPKRRDCGVEAIIDVVRQCEAAGVACFVKQDSAFRPGQQSRLPNWVWAKKEMPGGREE
jgi:protein gp37